MSYHAALAGCAAALLVLSGCDLAPVYRAPAPLLPASYHGSGPFVPAQPQDQLSRGAWWQVFDDPRLDRLEQLLTANNPDLQSAEETYVQATDLAAEARSGLFPQLTASGMLSDNKQSEHRLFRGATGVNEETSNEIQGALDWQPDFWDRIRNETRFRKAQAQAQAADLASARLSLQAQLASDVMALRGLDAQDAAYRQALRLYREAVSITQMRLAGKISSGLDVARAQNQLATSEAQDTEVLVQRTLLVHAIAVLCGRNPSVFVLPAISAPKLMIPEIPAGVPSDLLQRRPDIAEAERTMAAANALIGVARAAFYPDIRLSAVSGFEDDGFNLASLPNSLWAVGAQAMLPLFEGGLRRAELQRNWSVLAQAGDQYRATVLNAFQQVEDGLTLMRDLAVESTQQEAALRAAQRAQSMTLTLYTGGLEDYLDVTVAQIAALDARIAEVELRTRRLQALVGLVQSLGGGWNTAELPTPDQTLPFDALALRPGEGKRPIRPNLSPMDFSQ